jgi:hypothetical protein
MVDFSYQFDIPWLENVTFSSELNTSGQFSGTLNMADPALEELALLLTPGLSAIVVDFNGEVAWGGPLWTRRYTRSTKTLELGGSEFWSYFACRVQAQDYTSTWQTTPADPQLIAYTVTYDALQVNIPDQGLYSPPFLPSSSTPSPTDEWITASYPQDMLQTVDSIVSGLASQGFGAGGFDYVAQPYYDEGGNLLVAVNFVYPRLGRIYGEGTPAWTATFDVGSSDCIDFEFPEDASQVGNVAYEMCPGGSGPPAAWSTGSGVSWPILEQVVTRTGIQNADQNFLEQLAQDDIDIAGVPIVTPVVTMNAAVGVSQPTLPYPGDDVRLIVPFGDPALVVADDVWRIERIETTVPSEGVPTTAYTLNKYPNAGSNPL